MQFQKTKWIVLVLISISSYSFAENSIKEGKDLLKDGTFKQNFTILDKADKIFLNHTKSETNQWSYYYYFAEIKYQKAQILLSRQNKADTLIEIEKAIAFIKKSIALNDSFSDSHRLYADCLGLYIALNGIYAGAQYGPLVFKELHLAQKLGPLNYKVFISFGITYLNTPEQFGGSIKKAVESFKKSISLNALSYEAHTWLGIAYARSGNYILAEKKLQAALKINPYSKHAQFELNQIKSKIEKPGNKTSNKNNTTNSNMNELSITGNVVTQVATKGDKPPTFPIVQFKYLNNYMWDNDTRLVFFFMGPALVADIEKRHILKSNFNIELQNLVLLFVNGNTYYDSNEKILNSYSGHNFNFQIAPGFWLIDEKLKLFFTHRLNYNIYIKDDKTSQLPEDGLLNTSGAGLSYNTLFFMGNEDMEGTFFSINFEYSKKGIASSENFYKYYFDFQKNLFFSTQHRLFLKLRGGIINGANSIEEKAACFQIGSGFHQIINTYAYIVHGLYAYEFIADKFILASSGFKFPVVDKIALELDVDYAWIKENDLKRHLLGTGVKIFFNHFDSIPFYLLGGFAYNGKHENKRSYEIGLVVKKLF